MTGMIMERFIAANSLSFVNLAQYPVVLLPDSLINTI